MISRIYHSRILTELPGPKARALIEADERVTSPSLPRAYPLAVDHAQGCLVTDLDGNEFLDFAAGVAVCSTGHCHPRVVKAIQSQSTRLIHICGSDFYCQPYADLARKLAAIAPIQSYKANMTYWQKKISSDLLFE